LKFGSLFDRTYFLKQVEGSITDAATLRRVSALDGLEIDDGLYFSLTDDTASFVSELRHFSGRKTFFRKLRVNSLSLGHLPQLSAVLTHLSVGLVSRRSVRAGSNAHDYLQLREMVLGMMDALIAEGKCENLIYDLLFPGGEGVSGGRGLQTNSEAG